MAARHFSGLDLGCANEFTALAVLEQGVEPALAAREGALTQYAVRHLHRFELGTPYTEVCKSVGEIFAAPPLRGTALTVDQTGVGRPVVDVLRKSNIKAEIRAITITAGHQASLGERGGWLVPKKELVSTLQVLLQSRRIKVAPTLPAAQILVQELMNFRTKVTASTNDTLEAWREGQHDDLLLAVAIAAWQGERSRSFKTFKPFVIGSSLVMPRPY
jgi:hypothetical protein